MADFRELSIGDLVSTIDQWMFRVNDALLGQCRKTTLSRIKWWTPGCDAVEFKASQEIFPERFFN